MKSSIFPSIFKPKEKTSNCILLVGPGGEAYNKTDVIQLEAGLKNQGAEVLRIGDGQHGLESRDLKKLSEFLYNNNKPIFLFILAHGGKVNHQHKIEHVIDLTDESLTTSIDVIQEISARVKNQKLEIFSAACYSGSVCSSHDDLPPSSNYVALASSFQPVYTLDVLSLSHVLNKKNFMRGDLSAEKMLLVYLTKALRNDVAPEICSTTSNIRLIKNFVEHSRRGFTSSEIKKIDNRIRGLLCGFEINEVVKKLTNDTDWNMGDTAKYYGPALAISYAADLEDNVEEVIMGLPRSGPFTLKAPIELAERHPYYRGSGLFPDKVFTKGFTAVGTDPCMQTHAFPPGRADSSKKSAYISASVDRGVALEFPKYPRTEQTYLYQINTARQPIDVAAEIAADRTWIYDDRQFNQLQYEDERAFKDKIKSSEIKGYWEVIHKNSERITVKPFIQNPNYRWPGQGYFNTLKFIGGGLAVVGVTLDGYNLYTAYNLSKQLNDYRYFGREATGIAAGWTGAAFGGTQGAKAGVIIGGPFFPPFGSITGAFVGGFVGSVVGYTACKESAKKIFDINWSHHYQNVTENFSKIASDYTHRLSTAINKNKSILSNDSHSRGSSTMQSGHPFLSRGLDRVGPSEFFRAVEKPRNSEEPASVTRKNILEDSQTIDQDVLARQKELSQAILPIMAQVVEAFTDPSVKGFERNENIVRLSDELTALKSKDASPQKILDKTIELKNAKAKVVCEREKFDNIMENLGQTIGAASNIARIAGNNKLARQISVIGGSAFNVGQVIASLCGYSAAMMTPMGAVNAVLGSISGIMALNKSEIDSHQVMHQQTMEFLQIIHKEMHERFDEVMQGLGSVSRQVDQGFCSVHSNTQAIEEKIDRQERKLEARHNSLQDYSRTIYETLEQMNSDRSFRDKQEALLTVRQSVNRSVAEMKGATSGGHGIYDQARAEILNYAGGTLGSGATHPDLIGSETSVRDIGKLEKDLIDCHPYFHLRTLSSYCKQLQVARCPTLSTEMVHDRIKLALQRKNQFHLENVVTIGKLIETKSKNPAFQIETLRASLESETEATIKLTPIYVNARWSLVLLQPHTKQLVYFTLPNNEHTTQKIKQIAMQAGIDVSAISVQVIQGDVHAEKSHLWLTKAVESIAECQNIDDCVTKIMQVTLPAESKVEEKEQHVSDQMTINNPWVLWYLALKLLELTYSEHPLLGEAAVNISGPEIIDLQQMLEASDSLYQVQAQFSNIQLFEKLVADYRASLIQFNDFVRKEAAEFDRTVSKELNDAAKDLAKKHYYEEKLKQSFLKEYVQYSLYGTWYKDGYVDQINHKKSKYNCRTGRNQDVHGYDKIFHNGQAEQVAKFKHQYLESKTQAFDSMVLNNVYSAYGRCATQHFTYPIIAMPANQDVPYLPTIERLFTTLPDEIKEVIREAQHFGLGRFACTYDVANNQYNFNIHFIINDQSYCLSKLSVAYNPLFYTGKEAIWWPWAGGPYPLSSSASGNFFNIHNDGINHANNSFHHYASGPTISNNQGLCVTATNDPSKLVETMDRKDGDVVAATHAQLATIRQLIAAKKQQLQQRFCKELSDKLKSNQSKHYLQQLNVHYQVLKMFSQIVFPHCFANQQSALHRLFVQDKSVKNSQSVFEHLQHHPDRFLADVLLPSQLLDGYLEEVRARLTQNNGLTCLHTVDELQNHLLACLNKMVPNLVQLRTESEHSQFYGSVVDQMQQDLGEFARQIEANQDQFTPQKIAQLLKNAAGLIGNLSKDFKSNPTVSVSNLLTQAPIQQLLLTDTATQSRDRKADLGSRVLPGLKQFSVLAPPLAQRQYTPVTRLPDPSGDRKDSNQSTMGL